MSAPNVTNKLSDDTSHTIVSLLLVMHFFCVAVVLGGNVFRSELLSRLVSIVGPYTKTLHLDPNFVPFQITSGEDGFSRLHQWQVIDTDRITHRFPSNEWRGWFNRERQDMFARVGAFYAQSDAWNDDLTAAMSKAIAEHVYADGTSSAHLVIRCVRYIGDADPLTAAKESRDIGVLYEADVWRSTTNVVNVLKREEPYRLAPPLPTNVE